MSAIYNGPNVRPEARSSRERMKDLQEKIDQANEQRYESYTITLLTCLAKDLITRLGLSFPPADDVVVGNESSQGRPPWRVTVIITTVPLIPKITMEK